MDFLESASVCLLVLHFLSPRRKRVPERSDLRGSVVSQHPGELPLPLPHRLQLRAGRRRVLRHQRVLHQPEPLQVRLLQHGRGLPLRMSARVLPRRARVRQWPAAWKLPVEAPAWWRALSGSHRHCVTGLGFGSSSAGPGQEGEADDNSLSPEACYECKINGYPKKGRNRRSTNSTHEDIQVTCPSPYINYRWQKLYLKANKIPFVIGCSKELNPVHHHCFRLQTKKLSSQVLEYG